MSVKLKSLSTRSVRVHRAAAVRQLCAWRATRAHDERWKLLMWSTLQELPQWCADVLSTRILRMQLTGAVSKLPMIRRCISGDVLLALRHCLGDQCLHALRCRPYNINDCSASSDNTELQETAASDCLAKAASLSAIALAQSGIAIMIHQINDPLLRVLVHEVLAEEIAEALGDPVSSHADVSDHKAFQGSIEDAALIHRIVCDLLKMSSTSLEHGVVPALKLQDEQPSTRSQRTTMQAEEPQPKPRLSAAGASQ